ncbi:transposase [Dysgonomonas sp. 520]|nr:transposase [Dysgonomonas sp. 520]
MSSQGLDCVPTAIEFTAESLQINEPFIRSGIETYINSHYTVYTWAYLDAGLHSESVKGYSKQCALVQWIYDFSERIATSEPDAKRCEVLMRSFRMNLLTAISSIELEVKIPRSETRFNKWFDDVLRQLRSGYKPEDIIQIKRKSNSNAGKITREQKLIAAKFYKEGMNMSVANVYKKWLHMGERNGWWRDEHGNFNPPTEGRLYQILKPLKNPLKLAKTDAITHRAEAIPSISRELPEMKNHVWVIDGTAHNENVENKGTVRQHVYTIKVADVATLRLLGASSLIGVKEPFYAVKDAILSAIMETGYKPAIIQCDRGPAWTELQTWCEDNGIKLYPSITGNARAKTIESLFNMFDNDITRFLKGYSGQNRTALGLNSKPSDKRETEGKKNARSSSIAMEWIKNEGMKLWNERIIETLEGKPCKKTPYELWDEKTSYVPQLNYVQLCEMCGTMHEVKLTINGLDLQHKTQPYTYFPPIDTSEQRAIADRIFTNIPLQAETANRLKIYILNGGDPAPVFDHDGRYLGIWTKKKRTAYIAETKDEKDLLGNYTALQYRVGRTAKEINEEIDHFISTHPDSEYIENLVNEPLTGKRRKYEGFTDAAKRYTGRYDKSALLQEEMDAKAGDIPVLEEKKYKEYVDPDTGEIFKIETN